MSDQAPKLSLMAVSASQILHDYEYLLRCTGQKQEKRLARYRFICGLMGYNPDQFLDTVALPPATAGAAIAPEAVKDFFRGPASEEVYYGLRALRGSDDPARTEIKRAICAELTKAVNSNDTVYLVSCGYASRLQVFLRKNPVLAALFESRDALFLLKGSMAQKRVLAAAYPDRRADVEAAFGTGGDNDCTLLINPYLPGFAGIHAMACDAIHTWMLNNAPRIGNGSVTHTAGPVRQIEVGGVTLEARACTRQNFHICADAQGVAVLNAHVERERVYVSRNATIDFDDELQNRAKFELIRFKQAFEVSLGGQTRVFGGEILDIAVPWWAEYRLLAEFEQYKRGKWVTRLQI
jgi:hypothetical protein